ncbi:dihydromonapterin reductase [Parasalinivibrio latis]|uniref:dihydromonapterin reductase n=1 Tax=Parasalinivibrio latis TaxID=2952610 RepID=UPI0030E115A6
MDHPGLLVTGGGQRIGLHVAEEFLSRNIPVYVTYRTERDSIMRLRESGAICIYADFSTNEGIEAFIHRLKQHKPSLSTVIHNASAWAAEKNAQDVAGLMDGLMNVHVKAPYLINLALADSLVPGKSGGADIIHMTDFVAGKGSAKHIAYAASKAALENLTLSFAARLAPRIKVNSIAPALIMFNESDDEAYKKKALDKSVMQLVPGPEEVMEAIDFIMSSRYMTAQTIHLNGGRNVR